MQTGRYGSGNKERRFVASHVIKLLMERYRFLQLVYVTLASNRENNCVGLIYS
jgi:hypothetical protein